MLVTPLSEVLLVTMQGKFAKNPASERVKKGGEERRNKERNPFLFLSFFFRFSMNTIAASGKKKKKSIKKCKDTL